LKLRAERRLGELLRETGFTTKPVKQLPEGISKLQSHRWQTIATLPEADFEAQVATACCCEILRKFAEFSAERDGPPSRASFPSIAHL